MTSGRFLTLLAMGLVLLGTSAHATADKPATAKPAPQKQADKQPEKPKTVDDLIKSWPNAYTHAPEGCEFSLTFPEKPVIQNRCDGKGATRQCYDVVTYNQFITAETGINVRVTCRKTPPDEFKNLTPLNVEELLVAQIDRAGVQGYSLKKDITKDSKGGTVMGYFKNDTTEKFFVGQVWQSPLSRLSVEISQNGPLNDDAGRVTMEILSTIKDARKK